MDFDLFEKFCVENNIVYKKNEPMKKHTSFKIGGPADYFITVSSVSELNAVLGKAAELGIGYFVVGKGTNLLVSDKGIEGAVISLSGMNGISVDGEEIVCGAGASLSELCRAALDSSLTGIEFAYGIPGSAGGGLFMNAGAYGGEMSDVVKSAEYITPDGKTGTVTAAEMSLGYRTSVFKTSGIIITSVKIGLKKGEKADIEAKMNDFINRRRNKQPLEYPSAGSTFKRPAGNFAGALIEKNDLKGRKSGGAMVSDKHAGFIINYDNATCDDVKALIETVRDTVCKADGINLEPEIVYAGRE